MRRLLLVTSLLLPASLALAQDDLRKPAKSTKDADLGKKGTSAAPDKSLAGDLTRKKEESKAAPTLLHGSGGHGQHLSAMTKGCLAGTSVCFISNVGKVYPCGYLPVSAGDMLTQAFSEIWNASPIFTQLRNADAYEGKCGVCRYEAICGGCRARAYAATGNVMSEEPFCLYQPQGRWAMGDRRWAIGDRAIGDGR